MNKQYYCQLDNSVFTTEEELIEHIKRHHVKVFKDKPIGVSELLAKLKERYPDYDVTIEEGGGWYADYRIFLKKDGSKIEQYYGNDKRKYNDNPETFEDVVSELDEKISVVYYILGNLSKRYNFKELRFVEFSYGSTPDEHSYSFEFKLHNDNEVYEEYFYPYKNSIKEFINEFKKYFVTLLEGQPSVVYDEGYFDDYAIDGVKIGHLLRNSKKVRLEVIE